jgi:hypothetical protein
MWLLTIPRTQSMNRMIVIVQSILFSPEQARQFDLP